MSFKPGDKVWVDNQGGEFPAGTYAAVIIGIGAMTWKWLPPEWWKVDVEGIDKPSLYSHQAFMRPRYDPPDWVKLCRLDEVRPSVPKEFV